MTDSRELMLERALKRYMRAVSALATRSTTEPSRNLFDERPMSEDGVAAWIELNEAGKYAQRALSGPKCDICNGTGSADYAHFAMDPCPRCCPPNPSQGQTNDQG